MENFIYILIGIAWVAYSLYSARQKAIQKQAGMPRRGPSQSSPLPIPGNQGEGKSLFDEILRELTGESRPLPQPAYQPPVTVKPTLQEIDSSRVNQNEGRSGYQFLTNINTDFSQKEEDEAHKKKMSVDHPLNRNNVATHFNLRDAVIYSELLNPKYF